jgi:hypothetical protein
MEFQTHKPSQEQTDQIDDAKETWVKVINESSIQGVTRVEDAAKQMIALSSLLQGALFFLLGLSDNKEKIHNWAIIPLMIPELFWLVSLYCASRVFVPSIRYGADTESFRVDAWIRVRDIYNETLTKKLAWLRWSHLFLIIGFVAIFCSMLLLLWLPSSSGPNAIEVIIVTSTP